MSDTDDWMPVSGSGSPSASSDDWMPVGQSQAAGKSEPLWARPGTGFNRPAAVYAGAPVDALTWAINKTTGADIQNPVGGSESVKKAMGWIGANPDEISAPQTEGERLAEAIGAGAASMMIPGAAADVALARGAAEASPVLRGTLDAVKGSGPGSNLAIGAASGVGQQGAEDAVPDRLKPYAGLVGGLAGGLGAAGTMAATGAARNVARTAVQSITEPAEVKAARILINRSSDPETLGARLDEANEAPQIVPGSQPTTFQATGDMGLGAYERGVQASPQGTAAFAERRAAQNAARRDQLDTLSSGQAEPGAVSDYVKGRLSDIENEHANNVVQTSDEVKQQIADLEAEHNAKVQGAQDQVAAKQADLEQTTGAQVANARQGAESSLNQIGGQTFDTQAAYGQNFRDRLLGLNNTAKVNESRLWDAIDPGLQSPVSSVGLKQGVGAIVGDIPKVARPPSGEEAAIYDTIGQMPPQSTFGDMVALRSRLTTAIRAERMASDGESPALRRLSMMLSTVDDTMAGTAERLATIQSPQGQPSLLQRLQSEAEQWNAERNQSARTGSGTNASPETGESVGTSSIPQPVGNEGQAAGRPGNAAGNQGAQKTASILNSLKNELLKRDWIINHISQDDNGPHSYYLTKRGDLKGNNEIRISDHELGRKNGENQGGSWPTNVVIDPSLSLSDHLRAVEDYDYLSDGNGFRQGYTHAEFANENASGKPSVSEATPNVTEAYATARGATRERKSTYKEGPVGDVLRPNGAPGAYRLAPSNVGRKLFESPEALNSFLKAAKPDPDTVEAMKDYAGFSLRQAAVKNGYLDKGAYQKWMAGHNYVFAKFPDLRAKFETAAKAQAALDDSLGTQKSALVDFQKNEARRIIKTAVDNQKSALSAAQKTGRERIGQAESAGKEASGDFKRGPARAFLNSDDPVKAAGQALKSQSDMAALKSMMRGNPAAIAGLKRAVVEHMLSKTISKAEAGTSGIESIKPDVFQRFVSDHLPALSTIFNGQELHAMTSVAADLQRANRSIAAARIPGGSNTAQDLAQIHKGQMSVMERILWEAAGTAVGAAGHHPVAGFLLGTVGAALRAARMDRVQHMVTELMLDPQKAAAALAKVPSSGTDRSGKLFANRIRSLVANEAGRGVVQSLQLNRQ